MICGAILIPVGSAAWFSLRHDTYPQLLSDPAFWNTVRVSLIYTIATTGAELTLALGFALLLRERTAFNDFVAMTLLIPLMTGQAMAALIWKLITNPAFGVLGWLAERSGIHHPAWMSVSSSGIFLVSLVDIWRHTPFTIILFLAGLRGLPRQPFEAARLDGVSASVVFRRITLPLLMPTILIIVLLRALECIRQFDIVYALTHASPSDGQMLFQVRAYRLFVLNQDVAGSAAILLILWAIVLVLAWATATYWPQVQGPRAQRRFHGYF